MVDSHWDASSQRFAQGRFALDASWPIEICNLISIRVPARTRRARYHHKIEPDHFEKLTSRIKSPPAKPTEQFLCAMRCNRYTYGEPKKEKSVIAAYKCAGKEDSDAPGKECAVLSLSLQCWPSIMLIRDLCYCPRGRT
jgi:hypothetical protein